MSLWATTSTADQNNNACLDGARPFGQSDIDRMIEFQQDDDRQNLSKRVLQSLLLKKRVAHPYVGDKIDSCQDRRIDGNDSDKEHDAEERDALEVNIRSI